MQLRTLLLSEEAPMPTNEVTGTVYRAETDKIVPYATVTATCSGSTTSTTADESGYFDFNVPRRAARSQGSSSLTSSVCPSLRMTRTGEGDVILTGV
jgi:hypothetical protein